MVILTSMTIPDHPLTFPLAIYLLISCSLGIWSCGNIVIAGVRKRGLQHKCNYLISCQALCMMIHSVGGVFMSVLAFNDDLHRGSLDCFYIQCIPQFGMSAELGFSLMIGLDRFLSVKRPSIYYKMPTFPYVPFMTLFPFTFASITSATTFYCAYTRQMTIVRCSINGPLDRFLLRVLHWTHCIMCCFTLFIYLNVWHSTQSMSASKRKIIKALILIVSGFTASWFLTSVGSTIIYLTDLKDPFLYMAQFFFTGLSVLCGLWDYCIYFKLNTEYHRAFIEQLGCVHWFKRFHSLSAVTETSGWTGTESHNGVSTPIKKLAPTDTSKLFRK